MDLFKLAEWLGFFAAYFSSSSIAGQIKIRPDSLENGLCSLVAVAAE